MRIRRKYWFVPALAILGIILAILHFYSRPAVHEEVLVLDPNEPPPPLPTPSTPAPPAETAPVETPPAAPAPAQPQSHAPQGTGALSDLDVWLINEKKELVHANNDLVN